MVSEPDRDNRVLLEYPVETAAIVLIVVLAVVATIPRILGAGWAPQVADNFTTFQIIFSLLEVVGLSLVAAGILVGLALGYVPETQRTLTLTIGFSVIVVLAVAGVILLVALLSNVGLPPLVRVGGVVLLVGLLGVGALALPGWYQRSERESGTVSDP